jgi:ketosteroid isomerase-like protein
MAGRDAIRAYWQAEVVESQDDISFGSDVLHVDGDRAFVHWWSSFVRTRDGVRFRLDGAFVLEFDPEAGLCRSLREWWHSDRSF